jgi:DNA polymerase-3 subunit alpha
MKEQRAKFVEGCKKANNIPEKKANEIFDLLEKFAGYGFNKSHSAGYALLSYQTAYLKANHPVEFMAALLSNEISSTDKISVLVNECHRMGIRILAPDINRSLPQFAPETLPDGRPAIRYGLAAVKNVGAAAMEAAIAERKARGPFVSLEDFAARLDSKTVNRKILESLIKAGAFDFTGERRDAMFSRVGIVIAGASAAHRDRASGQGSLFDMEEFTGGGAPMEIPEEDRVEWSEEEYLAHEKDLLGFYVTGHPLEKFRDTLAKGKYATISSIQEMKPGGRAETLFAGIIGAVEVRYTKQGGKPFATLLLEDFTGQTEVMVWNEVYGKRSKILQNSVVIVLKARIEEDGMTETKRLVAVDLKELQLNTGEPSRVQDADPDETGEIQGWDPSANLGLNKAMPDVVESVAAVEPVFLQLDGVRDTVSALETIKAVAARYPGSRPLHFRVRGANGQVVTLAAAASFAVSDEFAAAEEVRPWVASPRQ